MRPLLHYLSEAADVASDGDTRDQGSTGFMLAGAISLVSLMQAVLHHQVRISNPHPHTL